MLVGYNRNTLPTTVYIKDRSLLVQSCESDTGIYGKLLPVIYVNSLSGQKKVWPLTGAGLSKRNSCTATEGHRKVANIE